LASQVVSKATLNVASQARAQALLHPKFWAQTAQVLSLQAPQLAYFASSQASTPAVKLNTRAFFARLNQWNRRRDNTPAAFLRLGNGI
jgi:hypothetical protein